MTALRHPMQKVSLYSDAVFWDVSCSLQCQQGSSCRLQWRWSST